MTDSKKQLVVSGPVAVIKTQDGSERYMYRGAQVPRSIFTAESIKHNLSVGLLSEIDAPADDPADDSGDEKPTDQWNNDRILAWAKDNSVDLGEAKTKAEYLAAIEAAAK